MPPPLATTTVVVADPAADATAAATTTAAAEATEAAVPPALFAVDTSDWTNQTVTVDLRAAGSKAVITSVDVSVVEDLTPIDAGYSEVTCNDEEGNPIGGEDATVTSIVAGTSLSCDVKLFDVDNVAVAKASKAGRIAVMITDATGTTKVSGATHEFHNIFSIRAAVRRNSAVVVRYKTTTLSRI